jgi:hypothetical protein
VADILVKGLAWGNPGDDLVPILSKPAWDQVGLDERSLAEYIDKASQEFGAIEDYLLTIPVPVGEFCSSITS